MSYRRDDFLMWMFNERYRRATIDDYDRRLRRIFKDLDLEKASKKDITLWLMDQEMRRGKVALNHDIKALNAYMKYIGRDIHLKLWHTRSEREIYVPSDEDVKKILAYEWPDPAITRRNQLIIRYAFLALRREEIAALNVGDVSENWISIRDSKMNVSRKIPMPKEVWALTREYIKYYRVASDDYALFTTSKGRINVKTIGAIFWEIGKALNIPLHTHACRHWRAVDLYKKGVDLEAIRKYLGHAKLSTTQIYLKSLLDSITLSQIYEKDDLFGGYDVPDSKKHNMKGGE